MSRRTEQAYPFVVAAVFVVVLSVTKATISTTVAKDLANSLVSILSITVGFLATALTILLTAGDLRRLQRLKTSKSYGLLIQYHWAAISLGFTSAIYSLVMIVASPAMGSDVDRSVFLGWMLCVAWAFLCFFRVIHLMKKLLVPAPPLEPVQPKSASPSKA